jgi:hypothetical protein
MLTSLLAAHNSVGGTGGYYGTRLPLIMSTDRGADRWSVERINAFRDGNGSLALKISVTLLESEFEGCGFDSCRDIHPCCPVIRLIAVSVHLSFISGWHGNKITAWGFAVLSGAVLCCRGSGLSHGSRLQTQSSRLLVLE